MSQVMLLNQKQTELRRSIELPMVDLGRFDRGDRTTRREIAATFDASMREIGFGVVAGHGVPPALLAEMMSVTRRLFEEPVADKRKIALRATEGQFCGWVPFGADAASRVYGAKTEEEAPEDLRERFRAVISDCEEVRQKVGPCQWPGGLPEVERVWTDYYRALADVGQRTMRLAAAALQVPEDYFDPYFERHFSVLMATSSPPTSERRQGQARCGVHTDAGTLSFVYQTDTRGGLEVHVDDEWLVPRPPAGSFVVNCGDLLAQWTNNRWRSTVHRVGGPGAPLTERRQSLVFFHQPSLDVKLDCVPTCADSANPPRFRAVTLREHFTQQQSRLATRDAR